jgi:hypothetical protein
MHDATRRLLLAGAAASAGGLLAACTTGRPNPPDSGTTAQGAPMNFDPMPPLPTTPTPGKPGDFDFLAGEWRIDNWRLKAPGEWDRFEGEASVYAILAGVGSVEELRIPARDFAGMGLRLLDLEKRVWSDFWVNAKSGALSTPGQTGSFENGSGIFFSEDVADGKPVIYAGVWDNITARTCRWRQASTRDRGLTWEQNWIMEWRRA